MVRWRRTTACERAAQWISLDLDGELGVLEGAGLARHLQRCARCRASSAEIGGFTRLLREAPSLAPEKSVAVAVPRRPWPRRHSWRVAVAAAAATGAAAGAVLLSQPVSRPSGSALGFASVQQQQRFARDHVATEPAAVVEDTALLPPLSLGLRALR